MEDSKTDLSFQQRREELLKSKIISDYGNKPYRYLELLINDIVLKDVSFENQIPFFTRYAENEGLDPIKLKNDIIVLIDILKSISLHTSESVIMSLKYQAQLCHISEEEISRILFQLQEKNKEEDAAKIKDREDAKRKNKEDKDTEFITKNITTKSTRRRKEKFVINGPFNSASFTMIRVDEGDFWMGDTFDYSNADNSHPVHKVHLSTYMIGETVVTRGLWHAVMELGSLKANEESLPMVNISWLDCQKFIKKLNSLTNEAFRMPTEAEWEFAARGGKKTHNYIYSGSQKLDDVGWFYGNSKNEIHAVAQKMPNELGIYDMSGNIWEWCEDKFEFYSKHPQTNPKNISDSHRALRTVRGGSISVTSTCHDYFRVCSRNNSSSGKRYDDAGMRLAL